MPVELRTVAQARAGVALGTIRLRRLNDGGYEDSNREAGASVHGILERLCYGLRVRQCGRCSD